MRKRQRYLNSEANGYLLEADACALIIKELERTAQKLRRRIDKEAATRLADFEAAMQYQSEHELLDDYGWGYLSEKQYSAYLDLFRNGKEALENHSKTVSELALSIVHRIVRDLDSDRHEYEFSALTPEEQIAELQRAEQARKGWKQYIEGLRKKRTLISEIQEDNSASDPPQEE